MKFLFVTLTLLVSICSYSQKNLIYPATLSNQPFNWSKIEKKSPKSVIDKFIKDSPKEFEAYRETDQSIAFRNLDSLRKDLHSLDINGDGKNDIVFDGQSGGEQRLIEIYINTGQHYKKVFSTYQGIVQIDWQNNQLSKLYIDDWGCCADYLIRHKIYDVSYNMGIPAFKQIYQGISIYQGIAPDTLLEKPIRFEILIDGYKIRSAPKIDDTSFQPWETYNHLKKGSGNSIGKLVKGAKGTAIAKKIDDSGREWFYVEIDEKYFPQNDIIYIEDKLPTKVIGWISGRFIRLL